MEDQGGPLLYDSGEESLSTFQIWIMALTKPDEDTYSRIIRDPRANLGKALLWVSATSLIGYSILLLANIALGTLGILSQFSEFSGLAPQYRNLLGSSLLIAILCVPVWTVVNVVIFLIYAGIVHFIASALGGTGTYSKLVYAFAAFTAPFSLIYDFLLVIPLIQCLAIFTGIYAFFLSILALKVVHRFSWGKSIGTFIILLVLMFFLFVIIGLLLMRLLDSVLPSQLGI
jgi:hypothetical protein